jgi:hypothetical protein
MAINGYATMKSLLARVVTPVAAVALMLSPITVVPAVAQTSSTVLNFDSVTASDAGIDPTSYLSGYGITVSGISGSGTPTVKIVSNTGGLSWVSLASPPNALVGPGGASATSYTLNLPSAVTSISFSRGGASSCTSFAGWSATALNSSGGTVSSVSDSPGCTASPQTFTLTGSGITALRIASNGCGCGVQSPFVDNLTFSPALASGSASAAGSASITAGTLSMGTLSGVSFSGTLNGQNQVFSSPTNAISVTDATGSGNGWKLTVSGTQLTTGGASPHTLSTTALQIGSASSPVTASAVSGSSGVTPTNSVSYPATVPLGTSVTAASFFNAALNTGMGKFDLNVPYNLTIPANTFAGTYTSTLTVSLVSGP